MFNHKKLSRERLEIYVVHLLLSYRPLIVICGLCFLLFSSALFIFSLLGGSIIGVVAVFVLLLGFSYPVVLFTARLWAWVATLGEKA